MLLSRVRTGVAVAAVVAGSVRAADPKPAMNNWTAKAAAVAGTPARTFDPNPAPSSAPTLIDVVAPAHREVVSSVVRQPTLTAKGTEDPFPASAKVYDWLLDHPDRTAQAWRRMGVPCVEINDLGNGQFGWSDKNGSEVTWRAVGRFPDGVVWLATGKVKPGALLPTVPVKAVAILHAPRTTGKDGAETITPSVRVYLLTDSKAASAVLRMFGPAVPRMAEQGAEQLLLFFSGVSGYLGQHPEKTETLLAPVAKKQ